MYIIPGYIKIRDLGDTIYFESLVFENIVKISDISLLEEARVIIKSGCNKLDSSLTNFLHEQKLLVSKDELYKELDKVQEAMNGVFIASIMPTEACNFRCPYCYETHQATNMEAETIMHIKDFIKNQVKNFHMIEINWFGGEPTLCHDIICDFNQAMLEMKKQHEFAFVSNMTTNGYLLNQKSFKDYYFSGIHRYQITLDGFQHDQTRPHVTGKATLQNILDNLKQISELPKEEYLFSIILRYNILKGQQDFSWYHFLKKEFGNDDRFGILVRSVSDFGGETVKELNLLKGNETTIEIRKHLDYLNQIGLKSFNSDDDSVSSHICYASYKNAYVFRANGLIEKCTVALGDILNQVGLIENKNGVLINQLANQKWYQLDLQAECPSCKFIAECMNQSCPKNRIIDKTKNHNCERMLEGIL